MVSAYKSYMKLVIQYLKKAPFPGAHIPKRNPNLGIGFPEGIDITENDIFDDALINPNEKISIGIIDLDIYSFYNKNGNGNFNISDEEADVFMRHVDTLITYIDPILRGKEYIKGIYYDIEWDGGTISVNLKPSDDFIRKTQEICKRNNIKLL